MPQNRNLSGCQVFRVEELPSEWVCEPLKKRIELAYGRALHDKNRRDGDVDVYGSNGKVGSHNIHWLEAPGVIVGRKGSIGSVHYASQSYWPIDTAYYVKPLHGDPFRYLYYLLQFLRLDFLNAATGVPGLSRRDAYALCGAFPSPNEQAAIACVLDAVDSAIERTRVAITQAKQLRYSLLNELLSRGVRREKQKKSQIGLIPTSWNCESFGKHIADGPTNGVYRPESDYVAHGTRIVRIDSFAEGQILDLAGLRRVRVEPILEQRYALAEGDILINRVNSLSHIGKAAIVPALDENTIFESNMMRLRSGPFLRPDFLIIVLCSNIARRHWLARAKPAVNQASINQRDVRELMVPLPEPDEQKEIAHILSASSTHLEHLAAVADAQQVLKRGLMQDLLTGRVRVQENKLETVHRT